jgi:hypothetical protein
MSAFGDSTHTGLGTNGFEVSLNYITGIPNPDHLLCSNTLKLAFKSLLKRDANTKEKSIASMLEYIKNNLIELDDDLVIINWVQMYPKLSIDDSKKVRSISHQIQSQFVFSLGKRYAKYLKDTIGIWLCGLFDSDRSTAKVCKDSFNFAFNNNPDKISNLWKIFVSQILHYSHQVLAFENKDTLSDERFATKDESESKYIRVLQASILLLVHTMNEINSIQLPENVSTLVADIYSQEVLQEAFNSKDFNLKKSSFLAFKVLITSCHVKEILNKHLYKALSKAMIKGIKFDFKVNILLYSTCLITILDTLVCITSYDGSFWMNIKKADEKLLTLIKYGSLNSEPIYYDVIFKLLSVLPKDFISINNPEKFEPFFIALLGNVEREKSIQFLVKGWKVINNMMISFLKADTLSDNILDAYCLGLIKLLDSPRILSPDILSLMHEIHFFKNANKDILVELNAAIVNALPDKKIVFKKFDNYTIKYTNTFNESFINLLFANKSDLTELLLKSSITALEQFYSTETTPQIPFIIINVFIRQSRPESTSLIKGFMDSLPNYITQDFIHIPLETLKLYSHSSYTSADSITPLVNKIFTKVQGLGEVSELLKIITTLKNFNIHETPALNEHLLENSKASSIDTASSSKPLYAFLTAEILANLFQNENFVSFVYNCYQNYKNDVFVEFTKSTPAFLEKLLLCVLLNDKSSHEAYPSVLIILDNLEKNLFIDEKFTDVYIESVLNTVVGFDGKLYPLVDRFSDKLIALFLKRDLLHEFCGIFNFELQKIISLRNPLNLGLYFFVEDYEKQEKLDFDVAKTFINKAVLYSDLVSKQLEENGSIDETLIFLSLIAEFASDFLFLEGSLRVETQDKIIDFQTLIKTKISNLFSGCSCHHIIADLLQNKSDHKPLEYIITSLNSENKLKSYYTHRVLRSLLAEKADALSLEEFGKFDFKVITNKPSLLFTILEACKRFLISNNLEYVRTNTVADLVGVRASKNICTIGLSNLVLLNNFIDVDLDYDIPETFVMIAPQRCLMLLNTLSNWMDSDVAYDESFKLIRITLIQFVQYYINGIYYVCDSNYPSDFIIKVFNLGVKLLSENINLINSEDEISIDLLSFTLKLYLLLIKYKEDIENWDDECSDVETEIIELFFKISNITSINQPITMICSQFARIFTDHIKISKFDKYYDSMYGLINSENVAIQRIAASLLHKIIPEKQDALVVEFALSKTKINEDGVSGIQLPKVLINNVDSPLADYIEYEEHHRVYQYLWSWYLIMDHFKNITQQMRQDYISNLGDDKISDFLNFIFIELNINKFKLHEDDEDYVKNYSLEENKTATYEEEIKKLLINLVYEIMNNIGGTFAQNWFQSIKNKQLQQSIEKFITSFISPQIINDVLSTLSNKTSIEDSEFKININRKFNEIKCLYHIDEQKMEFSIVLPPNYPLAKIAVNGISRVGVNEKKWKSWILSAQYVINFQNGSILDSIKHFKDNVTANFENFEDCAICYSILNAVDHSTPNKVCPTCKHNFHSACLYRWFKSSGASTCPLCRSKFQFKKHS